MWSPPDLRSIRRHEGRVNKIKKRQDNQTSILLINVRTGFTNQTRTCESVSTVQLQQKFQNFKKKLRGQSLFMFIIIKWVFLRRSTTHSGLTAALKEEAIAFVFGAMCTVKFLKKIEKSLKLYGFKKAQELCSQTRV